MQYVTEQAAAAGPMQDLGQPRLHSGPHAGGEDNHCDFGHRFCANWGCRVTGAFFAPKGDIVAAALMPRFHRPIRY
jgi:hypothetical protein